MNNHPQRQKTKDQMLDRGLEILAEQGVEGVTIDALCTGLGVTKGSFYHHFKNREHFQATLLEFWLEKHTEHKKALAKEKETPEERYAKIIEFGGALPHKLEKNIRAWAMHNSLAAAYQSKVDNTRLDYLQGLLEELIEDKKQARTIATIVLSTMIGLRHLFPPQRGEARKEILDNLNKLIGLPPRADPHQAKRE